MAFHGFTAEQKRWLYALITISSSHWPLGSNAIELNIRYLEDAMASWEEKEKQRLDGMFCQFEDCDQQPTIDNMCEDHRA